MGNFDGKVALVTGAGRMRGIGRAAAIAFVREGAPVTVNGTGRDRQSFPADEQAAGWNDIESVASEIKELGCGALPLVVDVTKADQVQDMVDKTVAEFGRTDFLVNNASAPRLAAWAPTSRNDALYGFPRGQEWHSRLETIPLGRAGQPEEIGNFIAWLCSKEAEFIVGQCIDIDGVQAA